MVTVRARITLQWLRDGSPTAGAGATTYALLAADSDTTHTVEVAPVTTGGATAGCATTSSGVADANSAPIASSVTVTDDTGDGAATL